MKTLVHSRSAASGLPKPVLIGATALIAFTIATTMIGRLSGLGTVRLEETRPVETLALRFQDRDDGGISVTNAADGSMVYSIRPGLDNFIRATVRGLFQARKRADIGPQAPLDLTRWSDGTISLQDSTTGRNIGLDAFGPTNAAAFARLFGAGERSR